MVELFFLNDEQKMSSLNIVCYSVVLSYKPFMNFLNSLTIIWPFFPFPTKIKVNIYLVLTVYDALIPAFVDFHYDHLLKSVYIVPLQLLHCRDYYYVPTLLCLILFKFLVDRLNFFLCCRKYHLIFIGIDNLYYIFQFFFHNCSVFHNFTQKDTSKP